MYKVAEAGGAEGKAKSFAEATKEALEMAERALNSGGHLSGFTTGLDSLNSKIGGLHKSDLIIVAGRPGMGKSALGTNMAFAAARRFLRDLEEGMSQPNRRERLRLVQPRNVRRPARDPYLVRAVRITSENLRTGRITQQEFREARAGGGGLQSLPLYIDDTPGLTIAALRTRTPSQTPEEHRRHRRRLSPAAPRQRQKRQ